MISERTFLTDGAGDTAQGERGLGEARGEL
jgi:hypothetical protein